jgi:hypothetical protein
MAGKGDTYRKVDQQKYEANYEAIFGKQKPKSEPKPKPKKDKQ